MGLGFLLSTGEDVKQLNGSVFGNIAKIEDRLGKFDSVANDMANKCNAVTKRSDGLAKELEAMKTKEFPKVGESVVYYSPYSSLPSSSGSPPSVPHFCPLATFFRNQQPPDF